MFYAPKGFIFKTKSQKLLKEGGSAAETLIDIKLDPDGSKGLKFSRIPEKKLNFLFFKIEKDLFQPLKKKGLIEDTEPSYQLGSTRLARYSQVKDPTLLKPGEEEAVEAALEKKSSYGDLDIDVEFKEGKTDEIFNFINSLEGFAAKKGINQIHIALVDGTDVYQIDLVNVKNKRSLYNFKEKSSFIDLSKGIKGAFSIILLRALASTKDTGRQAEEVYNGHVARAVKGDENAIEIVKAKEAKRIPSAVRYSLGDKGLVIKLVLEDDPDSPPKKQRKAKELSISDPAKYGYDNLDELAKYLLNDDSADGNDLYHAVKLADKISNLPNKQIIWDYFVGSAEENLKKGIDPEDYEVGMNHLYNIIFKENTQQETITEGRKGIGRFIGKNKFSNPKAFEVLKNIAKNSIIKDNKLIIDFNKDNIFLVEKVDSSFCHFGLDKKGQFFFETSSGKRVYSKTAEKMLGFSPDFLKTFKDLENNKNFQKSLKTIFNKFGSFKFSAEFFPVLTHKGTKDGQIIFVAVPYSRDKFGTKGGFVIFNINLLNDQGLYVPPDYKRDNEITSEFKKLSQEDGWSDEWKVYTNNEDMKKTSEELKLELEPELAQALENDSKHSRGLNPSIGAAGEQIQDFLDNQADNLSSNLSSKEDSFIEGLVLKILDNDGNITEIKGTSTLFDERKKEYWQDREEIDILKGKFEEEFLQKVLKFKSTNPAQLNSKITELGQKFNKNNEQNNFSLKKDFYFYLLKNLTTLDKDGEIENPENVKSRAIELLDNFAKNYSDLLENFKNNKKNLDQDSIRKTKEWFKLFEDKFTKIKTETNKNINKDYLFNLVNSILGYRIDNKVNFDPGQEAEKEENNRENVIIWTGRAQPWHRGHHAMIEKGISNLENTNSNKVLIFLVKGSGGSTEENPLTFKQQVELLNSIYKNNPKVQIAQEPLMGSHISKLADVLHDLEYNLTGWLAGPDRIKNYKENIIGFNVSSYLQDHNFSPLSRNSKGLPNLTFISTKKLFSGTESRKLALTLPFEEWLSKITKGMSLTPEAEKNYKIAYNQIRKVNNVQDKKEDENKTVNAEEPKNADLGNDQSPSSESLSDNEEPLEEMSTMGAGAVAGPVARTEAFKGNKKFPTIYEETQENYFIQREDLMEEIKLRKAIRNIITENKKKELSEEQRLRKVIRKMLTEGKKADEVIYQSTGVNALRDLLGNVGSVIKDKYRNLATSAKQREAFKNHLLIGWRNLLNIADISKSVDDKRAPKSLDDIELEEDIEIKIKKQDPSSLLADFEPKEYDPLKSKEQKLVAGGELPTDPDQKTGMNAAAECLNLISSQTLTSYEQLFNPKDAEDFKEYGLANIAAYLDEIEAEMTVNPEVDIKAPEGSVEVEKPVVVEDQIELSESLLKKLANFV